MKTCSTRAAICAKHILGANIAIPCCALAVLLLFFITPVKAQGEMSPRVPVTVVGQKWRLEIRNPKIEEDPFKAVKRHEEEERRRKDANRRNEILIEKGLPPENPPVRAIRPETAPRGITATYIYQVKVRSSAKKRITKLTWEYVFYEPDTDREVGRRRFESKVDIRPEKTKTIEIRSTSPPTGSVDATKAGIEPRELYSERIKIRRVEYADDSFWEDL